MPRIHSDVDLTQQLAARTLELVNIPSESRHEDGISSHVMSLLGSANVPIQDLGDTCLFVPPPVGQPFVLLAGHLDTVPSQGNIPGDRDDTRISGLGSSDMKSGVAVMIELALAGVGFGYLFFGREELPHVDSALTPLLEREPDLLAADLAIVMEPTSNDLHAGCLGNINATWSFFGRSAHSARPWHGDNAIVRAANAISKFSEQEPIPHDYEGLRFVEVASVTRINGGIAGNVIPDRVDCHVNYRYPPDITPDEALERIQALCSSDGELSVHSNAPSAPVAMSNPLVQELIGIGNLSVQPKQAWTPVAEFAQVGIDAVNFGPGTPEQAHRKDESVEIESLLRSYRTLESLAAVVSSRVSQN